MTVKKPLQIGAHHFHRAIPALRLLAQGLQHDRIEIAAQFAPHAIGRRTGKTARIVIAHERRWRGRRLLAHDVLFVAQQQVAQTERAMSGQEFAGDDPDRVDVGRRLRGQPHELLRAGVVRRERQHAAFGGGELVESASLARQSCDAEVQELDRAVGRDEDVARLEIAMHHQRFMRILHGRAQLPKQSHACADIE